MASSDLEKQLANLSPAKKALLERKRRESGAIPVLRRIEHREGIPLSFAQQRFWLIHQLDPKSYLYNVPRVVRLNGKLDRAALEASLNDIIRRHEALRTSFRTESGQPVQVVAPELRIELPISEVVSENGVSALDAALELAVEEYRRPFDLATGPVLRVRLWKLGEDDHLLLIVMHHIVSDGWSGGVLFDEIGKLYAAFAQGQSSGLPELSIQYPDFTVWQREWMDRVLDKQVGHWKEKLAGAPPTLELPTDYERPQSTGVRGHMASSALSAELSQRVIAFAQDQKTTLFPVTLAALQALMYRWTGQSDLVLGTVNANRNTAELEKLIGCFLNFLALRERIDGSEGALPLLERDKKTVLEAFANQDCPFEKIVEAVNPERAANVNPIYNVALLMQNYPAFAFRSEQIEARFLPLDTKVAFLDLRFVVTESAGAIVLECEANAELFERSTADLLLAGFRDALDQMIAEPERKLDDIRIPDALTKQARARAAQRTQTIAVAASFTAEPVKPALSFWMKRLRTPATIKFAPFNQIFQQLLDPASLLSSNKHGCDVILLRIEDLLPAESAGGRDIEQRLAASAAEFVRSLTVAAKKSLVPNVVCICPPSASVRNQSQLAEACDRAQASIVSQLAGMPNVAVVTPPDLLAHYPVAQYDDDYAWRVGKIPYTTAFFTALGTMLARRMFALQSAPYQVIVADCDQTLWTGNAQLGRSAVEVDGPRGLLQDFLIAQGNAVKILCLVGRGQKDSIERVLESNPGMRLGPQDLADIRIDDRPTSVKLKELSEEFGIDLSGFIFVSANPAECAEVRSNCSGATVAQLPAASEQIPHFLKHFWAFDSRAAVAGSTPVRHVQIEPFTEIAENLATIEAIARAVESERTRHGAGGRSEYAPPRNAVEEMLAGIWAQVLRVERPGINDNFFALGGHSLLAVQVVARVRETLNVEMPLRAMFDAPTIGEFAKLVEAARTSSGLAIPVLRAAERKDQIPLSYAQQRLWFIDQLEPGNSLYNISAMYRMWGPLDLDALEKTINEIVRRHESLRTTFRSEDGQPVQVIVPRLRMQIPVSVRGGLSEEDRELEIRSFAREQALQPFDLSMGPLLRFSLLKLAEEEHVLVVILHHIVGDGWSGSLLAREMAALYEAFSQNQPSPLPELTVQYADFAIWQRQWIQGEILDGQIAYWKKQLAGAPPVLELPADRPRPAVQAHHGAIRTHVIARDLVERLKSMSQAEGVTLFMTLLASFQLLLSRYSGQEDIVVGSTVAGRNYSEIEPLIGFFINTLAMRTDLSGEPTFRELL
ncbi:MAG TPA: condensation domain-containing protein, partial [Terriglobales bacterium]